MLQVGATAGDQDCIFSTARPLVAGYDLTNDIGLFTGGFQLGENRVGVAFALQPCT